MSAPLIPVKYESNNSGGEWWLKDKDWLALERAGWHVEWGRTYFCRSRFELNAPPAGKCEPCPDAAECHGHRRYESLDECLSDDGRWLGAAATSASKSFPSIADALREFERLTGQNVMDEGCGCCGAPHLFSWGVCVMGPCKCRERSGPHDDYHYGSGELLAQAMFGDKAPKSLREAIEAVGDGKRAQRKQRKGAK